MQGLSRTSLVALVIAVLLALIGLTFIGQGLGIITGKSLMVGDGRWAVIGAVVVIVAVWWGRRTWTRRAR